MPASDQYRVKILSFSNVFPTPQDPGNGLFVRSRLSYMARLAEIRVIAPLPIADYGHPDRKLFDALQVPRHRIDAGLEVDHPLWFYPPLGGAFNARLLAWQMRPRLTRLYREFSFQIIDAHHGHPNGITAAMLAGAFGCPFTVTLRGNEHTLAKKPSIRRWMAWSLAKAARVITVSERLRQLAIELGTRPGRAVTIPNGIDDRLFYPRDRDESRRKHGLPADARIVLSAGSLCVRKGHHRVARALQYTDAFLVIAGGPAREGSNEAELRRTVSELGMENRVKFTGHVSPSELAELMSAADVFCLASSQEGWPNVVHEAMACGAPIVATDVGALPDMVSSEEYGSVVPLAAPEKLEKVLTAALGRAWNRKRIADWARARSWDQVAREVIDQMTAAVAENGERVGRG